MADFDKKCETQVVPEKAIKEFASIMNNNWSAKDLIHYINITFEYNGLDYLIQNSATNCIDVLKAYLIDYALDDIKTNAYNLSRHQLLVAIYKFLQKNGYLPKIENIV